MEAAGWHPWIVPFLIVAFASAVQGVAGFAFGIISMACLSLLWDPQKANVVVSLLTLYSLTHPLWHVRRHIRWERVGWLMAGGTVGLPIGTHALVNPEGRDLLRLLVAGVCVVAAVQNWRPPEPHAERWGGGRVAGFLAGVASGFLSGCVSSGGPPILWYIYHRPWTKDELKATVLAVFLVNSMIKLTLWMTHDLAFSEARLLTPSRLAAAVLLLVPTAIGSWVGVAVFKRIDRERFRHVVCALLGMMAVFIVATVLGA